MYRDCRAAPRRTGNEIISPPAHNSEFTQQDGKTLVTNIKFKSATTTFFLFLFPFLLSFPFAVSVIFELIGR